MLLEKDFLLEVILLLVENETYTLSEIVQDRPDVDYNFYFKQGKPLLL